MIKLLTDKEMEIINKKINNEKLNQVDSNTLSKYIRPKLRYMASIDSETLLNKIEYNKKAKSIEKKIKDLFLTNISGVISIVLYGSAVQTNYKNYNDIDVIVITKNKVWNKLHERTEIITKLKKDAEKLGLKLDIKIVSKNAFYSSYLHDPGLIYQLKDHKIIYGKLKLKSKINIPKMALRMKLDWSDMEDIYSEPKEIYGGIRNTVLVRLLLDRIISNSKLNQTLMEELGKPLIKKLRDNSASRQEKKMALKYLKEITEKTRKEIIEAKWQRIEL